MICNIVKGGREMQQKRVKEMYISWWCANSHCITKYFRNKAL